MLSACNAGHLEPVEHKKRLAQRVQRQVSSHGQCIELHAGLVFKKLCNGVVGGRREHPYADNNNPAWLSRLCRRPRVEQSP